MKLFFTLRCQPQSTAANGINKNKYCHSYTTRCHPSDINGGHAHINQYNDTVKNIYAEPYFVNCVILLAAQLQQLHFSSLVVHIAADK